MQHMQHREVKASMFDMLLSFARALDFLHSQISGHHLRVANLGSLLAEAAGFSASERADVVIAGALHDIGVISIASRLELCNFSLATYEGNGRAASENVHRHGHEGYLLLQGFAPFANAARIIRYHHVHWADGAGAVFAGDAVPLASHLIHLADRISVLPRADVPILAQRAAITAKIRQGCGSVFHPDLVAVFETVAASDAFWFDLVYPHQEGLLRGRTRHLEQTLDLPRLQELARVFGRIIDFRSPFTAAHSSGVAAAARGLAELCAMDEEELALISVAGHLHDLGKLAVPPEIIDKPGALNEEEANLMRSHAYHTYRILENVPGLETVNVWASFHHERIGGDGYPFRPPSLPLGARIVAVADVFTALSEDRPYRQGMAEEKIRAVLADCVERGSLDGDIVKLLQNDYARLDQLRRAQQALARAERLNMA